MSEEKNKKIMEVVVSLEETDSGLGIRLNGSRLAETDNPLAEAVANVLTEVLQHSVNSVSRAVSEGMSAMGIDNKLVSVDRADPAEEIVIDE